MAETTGQIIEAKVNEVVKMVEGKVAYYNYAKGKQKYWSKRIRLFSIILIGLGGICPLVGKVSFGESIVDFSNYGYISIALAGTLLFLDKFFGFSSAWIRFMTTSMEIESQTSVFRQKMEIELFKLKSGMAPDTPDKQLELLLMVKDFTLQIDELVKQETQNWAVEFQSNIAELMKMASSKMESMNPGCVKVTIKSSLDPQKMTIKLDGIEKDTPRGNEVLIEHVSPGSHTVIVSGNIDGIAKSQSAVVSVDAGKMTPIEIELK